MKRPFTSIEGWHRLAIILKYYVTFRKNIMIPRKELEIIYFSSSSTSLCIQFVTVSAGSLKISDKCIGKLGNMANESP